MIKRSFFSIVCSLFTIMTFAQNSTENSLLWKVEGNGLSHPSYVYGTYHMMCSKDYQIKEKVNQALNATEQFVMEVNYSDPNLMTEMQNSMMKAKKIGELFSSEEQTELKKHLPQYGYDYEFASQLSPIVLNSMLTMKYFDCGPESLKMMDTDLMSKAIAASKPVSGLETVDQQLQMLSVLVSNKDILKSLSKFNENKAFTQKFVQTYNSENLLVLNSMMRDKDQMSEEQAYQLLDKRNIDWLTKMPNLMKEKSTFFAVGAGHLAGENGVLTLLKNKGYKITPIL